MAAGETLDWIARGRAYLQQGAPSTRCSGCAGGQGGAAGLGSAPPAREALQRSAAPRRRLRAPARRWPPRRTASSRCWRWRKRRSRRRRRRARAAAARAGRLAPVDVRPLALHAVARLRRTPAPVRRWRRRGGRGARRRARARAVAARARRRSPARSRRAIDAARDADRWRRCWHGSRGCRSVVAAVPAPLLALVVEHAASAGLSAARAALRSAATERDYAPGDHDALRRIALAATVVQAAEAAAPARALRRAVRRAVGGAAVRCSGRGARRAERWRGRAGRRRRRSRRRGRRGGPGGAAARPRST